MYEVRRVKPQYVLRQWTVNADSELQKNMFIVFSNRVSFLLYCILVKQFYFQDRNKIRKLF